MPVDTIWMVFGSPAPGEDIIGLAAVSSSGEITEEIAIQKAKESTLPYDINHWLLAAVAFSVGTGTHAHIERLKAAFKKLNVPEDEIDEMVRRFAIETAKMLGIKYQ